MDCRWDEALCIEKMNELCKTNDYPTAFFAASDLMAMAALNSLYNNGISVPDQVAVMGLSNIEVSSVEVFQSSVIDDSCTNQRNRHVSS
ncbi:substrate-binding domain-containing protein [Paenibacillus sp. GXUN7292]|uniref:substrate-binding domain-containing protein n=1 Tax=Paenibacillus sp. GXUN7292 TaxID=3422499 RepID=UPI003D7DCA45